MHPSCSSIPVLFPLFYALFAQTALLPATISLSNRTFLGLPIINFINASATSIPVSSRTITLAFIKQGRPIPEQDVVDTLVNADLAINELVRHHPTQRITNDRFEYRRLDSKMLISIRTNAGETISWMELGRVLQGLYRYMTGGVGTEEAHYRALEFEIEASGQEKPNIGYGVVWYLSSTESEIQKRVPLPPIPPINQGTLRPPSLTFQHPSNETLRQLPNATISLPGANNVPEHQSFPIRHSSLSLEFYLFGASIPARSVKDTLQGAMASVRPFLNGQRENDPIENGGFRWVLPLSRGAGIPVVVTIFAYHGHIITYRHLFDVLFGLYAFTTTFGTDLEDTHYQILGFRIQDLSEEILGVGSLSYFSSGTSQLAKRAEAADDRNRLQRPSALKANSIVYPVSNTNITLTFTFLGDTRIPSTEIHGALNDALQKISEAVVRTPDDAIPGRFTDVSSGGRTWPNVLAYSGRVISWKELDSILRGVLHFCQDDQDHDRTLVFEIDIEAASRGRVGFGTLLYEPFDPINVEQQIPVTNGTILQLPFHTTSQPNHTAETAPVPYPIPGTPMTLVFDLFGSPIQPFYVGAALTSALRKIQNDVTDNPGTPIPNGHWEYNWEYPSAATKLRIAVNTLLGKNLSWLELSTVVAAVLHFMTGAGDHRCHELHFFIDKVRRVPVGYGSVALVTDS